MISVARWVRERPGTVARTLRESYSVGLSDLGDGLSWGECWTLLQDAAGRHDTALGAELADWAYPATMVDLISLSAQIGDPKVSKRLMPWAMGPTKSGASEEEVALANAELEASMVFA